MRWLCIVMVLSFASKSLSQELLFTSLPSKNRHLLFLIQGGQAESHEIFVQGWYCHYQGERGLFLSRSDCLAGNIDNGIRLQSPDGWFRQLDAYGQPRLIEVSGDFTSWRQHRPTQSVFVWGELKANGRHISDNTPFAFRTVAEQQARAEELRQHEEKDEMFWKLMDLIYDQEDQCISPIEALCDENVSFEQALNKLKQICQTRAEDPSIAALCELVQ